MDKADFEQKIAEGGFLEYANVYGNYYGTPLGKIEERLAKGEDILLEIDTQGALNVMKKCPDGLFIFLVPPSLAELERRIRGRGSETEESLQKRMGSACKEIEDGRKYSYVVVNDTVKHAVQRILAIRAAEHCRVDRNQEIFEELAK
jgi:guanylate kinase